MQENSLIVYNLLEGSPHSTFINGHDLIGGECSRERSSYSLVWLLVTWLWPVLPKAAFSYGVQEDRGELPLTDMLTGASPSLLVRDHCSPPQGLQGH